MNIFDNHNTIILLITLNIFSECKFRYYLTNLQISGIIKSRYSPENTYI